MKAWPNPRHRHLHRWPASSAHRPHCYFLLRLLRHFQWRGKNQSCKSVTNQQHKQCFNKLKNLQQWPFTHFWPLLTEKQLRRLKLAALHTAEQDEHSNRKKKYTNYFDKSNDKRLQGNFFKPNFRQKYQTSSSGKRRLMKTSDIFVKNLVNKKISLQPFII